MVCQGDGQLASDSQREGRVADGMNGRTPGGNASGADCAMGISKYLIASSVEEALGFLDREGGRAQIIAGGTDLVLELGKVQTTDSAREVASLVDISRIHSLHAIWEADGRLHVGAASTHKEVATSALVRSGAIVLADAALAVGSPQVREVGTIGGNVVNALPAADTAIALTALDADATVATAGCGERVQPIIALYAGVGRSTVNAATEIVTEFSFPIPTASAFQRLARRKALALPILNTAAVLDYGPDLVCRRARVVVGPMAVTPWRACSAEAVLQGFRLTDDLIVLAARAAEAAATCRDSIRACSLYRKPMVRVLVERALRDALRRGPT